MTRTGRRKSQFVLQTGPHRRVAKVGAVLLALRNAVRRAERCRRLLKQCGFSERRWQEIVKDVDPELRFMVRPQILDAIVAQLKSVGKPVGRKELERKLSAQGAGSFERIRQSITASLRSGKLALFGQEKIGMPEWKKIRDANLRGDDN